MKKLIILLLILLVGCSNLSDECKQECSKYDDSSSISSLLGVNVGEPKEVICLEPLDCKAKYKVKDTEFEVYYFKNDSTNDFAKEWNHEMLYFTNCTGELCDSMNEFHYKGVPRNLKVVCKKGMVSVLDQGSIEVNAINCDVFKEFGKYKQRTWVCDYNTLIKDKCE